MHLQSLRAHLRRFLVILGFVLLTTASGKAQVAADSKAEDQLAYATALQAAIYGYALEGMQQRLSAEIIDPATRKTGFNEYLHFTALSTPEVAPFRAPNNDTFYSTAWLDLRQEPVILQMPATEGRYYTAHLMDFYTETIANIGQRVYGTEPGLFAIVGPGWKGKLPDPDNIKAIIRCDTVFALVLLRVLVDGPEDVPAVVSLQKNFRITSLSRFLAGQTGADPNSLAGLRPYAAKTAQERFKVLDEILKLHPVRSGEEALMSQFATIGIGPASVAQRLRTDEQLLARAQADALKIIQEAGVKSGKMINGWIVKLAGIGRYGFDYLERSSVWDGGPLANVPEESIYASAVADSSGAMLTGKENNYRLHFAKGQIPPVNAFWSLTIYKRRDGYLVKNPINRYSIGNRTRGVKPDADGSLTILIQHESPGKEKESNWLPAPDEPFYMVLRIYGPKPEAVNGQWLPSPINKAR